MEIGQDMQTASNEFQLLIAYAIFTAACGGPMRWLWVQYHRPSPFFQRPWRVVAVLLLAPLAVFPLGYVAVLLLSYMIGALGWSIFNGDDGFKALFALIWASVFLVLAGIVIGMLALARRLPAGALGHKDGRDTPGE